MPAEIARALSAALVWLGTAMRQADGQEKARPLTSFIPLPRRSVAQELRDRLLRRAPAEPLLRMRDPEEVSTLPDHGWSVQVQVLLVMSPQAPSSGAPADAAVAALCQRRDWRGFRLEPPVQALLVPGNDGDSAMVAAPSATTLATVLARIEWALAAAGFPIRHQGQEP